MRFSAAFEPYAEAPALLEWLEARYGLAPELFSQHRFWVRPGAEPIWIASEAATPPGVLVDAFGLKVLHRPPPGGKLTTSFIQRFGARASKQVVHLERLDEVVASLPVDVDPALHGHTILMWAGVAIGSGVARAGVLTPELPKRLRSRIGETRGCRALARLRGSP